MLTLGNTGYCFTFAWIDVLTPVLDLDIIWPDEVINFRAKLETLPEIAAELELFQPLLTNWLIESGVA